MFSSIKSGEWFFILIVCVFILLLIGAALFLNRKKAAKTPAKWPSDLLDGQLFSITDRLMKMQLPTALGNEKIIIVVKQESVRQFANEGPGASLAKGEYFAVQDFSQTFRIISSANLSELLGLGPSGDIRRHLKECRAMESVAFLTFCEEDRKVINQPSLQPEPESTQAIAF